MATGLNCDSHEFLTTTLTHSEAPPVDVDVAPARARGWSCDCVLPRTTSGGKKLGFSFEGRRTDYLPITLTSSALGEIFPGVWKINLTLWATKPLLLPLSPMTTTTTRRAGMGV